MPRDRFYAITRHFHLVDSTKQAKKEEIGYDPLFKVRPVIDQILDLQEVLSTRARAKDRRDDDRHEMPNILLAIHAQKTRKVRCESLGERRD